jgi:ribosomal protein L6P/L9E
MSLFKYTCLLPFNQQLLYIECNSIITFGILSTRKIQLKQFLLSFVSNSSFFIYRSIFCNFYYFLSYWQQISSIIQSFFFGGLFGYYHGFRLLGRGYKTYLQLNNYTFRLGYSHNIYYCLPLNYKAQFKEKTKNFWILKASNNILLSNIIAKIRNFKIPNTYRYKGIYRINDSYVLKATKKGGSL